MAVISNEKLQSQWKVFSRFGSKAVFCIHEQACSEAQLYILFFLAIKPNCTHRIGLSVRRHIASMGHISVSRQVSPASVCVCNIKSTRLEDMDFWCDDKMIARKFYSMHILTTISSSIFVLLHFVSVISAGSDHEKTQISKSIKL